MYYKKIRELLIFGIGEGEKPQTPLFTARRSEDRLDLLMTIEGTKDAVGYNILWGHEEGKLYHSYQIYREPSDVRKKQDALIRKRIGALVKSQEYFVRVDAYNENGITRGQVIRL